MKRLFLGSIPDDYNPVKDIPASPACFLGREHIYPQFENLEYVKIINNKESLKQYDILTTQVALKLVSELAAIYNQQSFNKYPFRSWKTIYFPCLGAIIPWLYRKQLLSQALVKTYKDEKLNVQLIEGDLQMSIQNETELINSVLRNPEINAWALSKFVKSAMPKTWIYTSKEIKSNSNSDEKTRIQSKSDFKSKLSNFLIGLFFRSYGIYGIKFPDNLLIHILLSLKPAISRYYNYSVDSTESTIEWDTEIFEIIDKLIPNSLKNISNQEISRRYTRGKLINYSNRLYYNENSKLDAAHAIANNEIIIATQHGGHNYGSAYTFEYGKEIEYKTDLFISWGSYLIDPKANVLPLPSPLLSKKLNSHHVKNNSILMVGTDMRVFQNRFDSIPDEINYLYYRKDKLIFLDILESKGLIGNVLYRPYPHKKTGYLDEDYVLNKFPALGIHKGNLHNDMKKCRFLILDHPGTTWNIAMSMNIPTICFWRSEYYPFNNEASAFLERFQELGLYFDNPKDAAKQVYALLQNESLEKWWNSTEIQLLRKEWMKVFAMADKNWRFKWIKKLWVLK